MKTWPAGISEELQHYVYRLLDPRSGETFYVGKGMGDRVFHHAQCARQLTTDESSDDSGSLKLDRIRDIQASGEEVGIVIHRHGLDSNAAFEVEAALIDCFPNLTNLQGGHGSSERGVFTSSEIVQLYALPELTDYENQKLLLININRVREDRGKTRIYDQTRFCWRLNVKRAATASYVLAVEKGVVLDAFIVDEWKPATIENFPEFGINIPERWGFVGKRAPDDVLEHFVGKYGKRITHSEMRHVQNPIRYWNI